MKQSGERYHCPFCGYKGGSLKNTGQNYFVLEENKVIGGGQRANACHKCGSKSRERHILIYLKDQLKIFDQSDIKILHIAPQYNLRNVIKSSGLEGYQCGDLFTEGYDYPDYVKNMDVCDLPFEEENFDLVLCNHVLEHVERDVKAMGEILRVLRPQGKAILLVPFSPILKKSIEDRNITTPEERAKAYGQRDHVRLYGTDYFNRLEGVGFRVEKHNLSAEYPKMGIDPREDIILCQKK